jgi:hypothetical protein
MGAKPGYLLTKCPMSPNPKVIGFSKLPCLFLSFSSLLLFIAFLSLSFVLACSCRFVSVLQHEYYSNLEKQGCLPYVQNFGGGVSLFQ